MGTLKKAIKLLSAQEKRRGLFILLLVLGLAILEAAGVASIMPFLAILGNPEVINTNNVLASFYHTSQNFNIKTLDQFLIVFGFCVFILIFTTAVYRTFTYFVLNNFIEILHHKLSIRLLESYLHQPYEFFLSRHSGDMSTIILSRVTQVVGNVFRPALNMVIYALVLLAMISLLLIVNPWLALCAASLMGGLYLIVFISLRKKLLILGDTLVTSDKLRYITASEVFGGIKDIKLLGRERSYIHKFEIPSLKFAHSNASYLTLNMIPHFVIEAIIFGAILLLTVVLLMTSGGSSSGALGQILPVLGLYAFAVLRMRPAIQNIYQGFASLRYGQAAVESLYDELLVVNLVSTPRVTTHFSSINVRDSITLDNLSYVYPGSSKLILKNLDLVIPVGSVLGVVGTTGAGKTTFVDIILGLLQPSQGSMAVGGVHITKNNMPSWQRTLGYVPQEIFLTDTTIAENIALGISKDQIDYEHVLRCATMSQLHNFIMQDLPQQYGTLVGERGVRLSGGQRQRIGIARALYHNPQVLVFDEATSSLDSITEKAVMEAINSLAHDKTIIIVAHRLSTVKNCNQIILLDNGEIKAKGTFDELNRGSEKFKMMSREF